MGEGYIYNHSKKRPLHLYFAGRLLMSGAERLLLYGNKVKRHGLVRINHTYYLHPPKSVKNLLASTSIWREASFYAL